MALYAFDGTWNKDKPGTEDDTNVVAFRDAYRGPVYYQEGVGTRFGKLGRVIGGITGAGGRTRVDRAYDRLVENFRKGDEVVDIVGFSRGAALALHFANRIASKGASGAKGAGAPSIRFLGLWDTVPSFGAPSIPANIGWDLDLPDNVEKCFHALALDERRHTFKLHRLEARVTDANGEGRLFEVWFRGVHSDVGGGNRNNGLSSIALAWMFAAAARSGLPIDPAAATRNDARMNPDAPISIHEHDLIKNPFRIVRWNDAVHESVRFRSDTAKRQHNNPPAGLARVNDRMKTVGSFQARA